jgi:hypothetical protein
VLRVEGRVYLIDWIRGVPATAGHRHAPNYFSPERLTDLLVMTGFTSATIMADRAAGSLLLAEATKRGVAGGGSHGSGGGTPLV